MLTFLIRVIVALASAASLGIIVYVGDNSSLLPIALTAVFGAWLCAPYVIAWIAAGKLSSNQLASGIVALGLIIVAGFGLYAYAITFFFNEKPDAQDGLVFAVIPAYQLGAMLLVWGVASLVERLRKP